MSDEGYHHWKRLGKTNSDTKIQAEEYLGTGFGTFQTKSSSRRNFLVFDH